MQTEGSLNGSAHHMDSLGQGALIWVRDLDNQEVIHSNLGMDVTLECRPREVGLPGIILEDNLKVRVV